MSDLTEFLLARIAEDEAVAQNAAPHFPSEVEIVSEVWEDCVAHIARHDPARVLAECEAKRRIVEDRLHLDTVRPGAIRAHSEWACRVIATVYADHPDYREEWA